MSKLEEKIKFFGLYYNQPVLNVPPIHSNLICNHFNIVGSEKSSFLSLYDLSSITDNDAIWVHKILTNSTHRKSLKCEIRRSVHDLFVTDNEFIQQTVINFEEGYCALLHPKAGYRYNPYVIFATDFLRLNGYALPFNGVKIGEQVSRNWITLKE